MGHPMRLELTRVGLLVELANYYTTRGAFDLATDGRESCSKEKPDKLSFINATRCRHNHKTRYELNLSKNDLFTDSVNINIHTPLNKFIFY